MKLPTKRELRDVDERSLTRLLRDIEGELGRRDLERERAAAEERARTVVESRLVQEFIRCGKPHCHCALEGTGHGPYWYAIDTYGDGRRRRRYIGRKAPKRAAA